MTALTPSPLCTVGHLYWSTVAFTSAGSHQQDRSEDKEQFPEMDQKDTEMNEKGVSSSTSGVVVQVREKKGVLRAAIPCMPFPVAVICLFLNTFVPGLGELSSSKSN